MASASATSRRCSRRSNAIRRSEAISEKVGDYADYLHLDRVLRAQHPLSDQPDEMMFIIIHQATELWLKLVTFETRLAMRHVAADDLGPAFKALARVARIQHVLIESWQVLSTMTPTDYLQFRSLFGTASGLQSSQYREIEFLLGRRSDRYLDMHGGEARARLTETLAAPSLYDEALLLLERRGLLASVDRDWSTEHQPSELVTDAWLDVYRDPARHWDLYELAEKLVDVEHAFSRWRYEHYQSVHRIIGSKPGSGGTTGLAYLKRALDFVFFPELWDVRTRL